MSPKSNHQDVVYEIEGQESLSGQQGRQVQEQKHLIKVNGERERNILGSTISYRRHHKLGRR